MLKSGWDPFKTVSIHAPTGGATTCLGACSPGWKSFNPRAHGRRDHYLSALTYYNEGFNPRAHGRRDLV